MRKLPISLLIAAAAVVGCSSAAGPTGSQQGSAFRPSYQLVRCPAEVQVQLVVTHSCGYLTVLQDRAMPDGRQIKIFVVKIIPSGANLPADPVLTVGNDMGFTLQTGSTAPLAERVGRIAYLMDPRGTGHSLPGLACPEVNRLTAAGLSAPSNDPDLVQKFLGTVKACRERLARDGINVADYDLAAVAADAKDLRMALGIRKWDLASYGTYSGAVLQAIRIDPGGVRAAFIDSPVLPQTALFSGAPAAMQWALGQLFSACDRDSACNQAAPDLAQDWSQALSLLGQHPAKATLPGTDQPVTVDAGKLVLAVRSALSNSGSASIGWLPAAIKAAAAGQIAFQLLNTLAAQPMVFENGYQPGEDFGTFSLGAYLSEVCRDEAPFTDHASLNAAADNPATSVLADDPNLAACKAWQVPSALEFARLTGPSVPILVLTGQFDAFSPTPAVDAATKPFARAWEVQVPWQVHNVLGGSVCALTIRNRWLDNPALPPDTACIAGIAPPSFTASTA